MHPRHAYAVFAVTWKYTSGHQGCGHRHIRFFCNTYQQIAIGNTVVYTAADYQHWPFCSFNVFRYFFHLFFAHLARLVFILNTATHCAAVVWHLYILRKYVFRNINDYRTRTTGLRYKKCFFNNIRQLCRISYRIGMFTDRLTHRCHMCFLETVFPQKLFYYLPHNAHHRNGVHIRSGNPGNQIGSTRTGCRKTYAYFPGSTRIAIGCVRCTLLMTHQNVMNIRKFLQSVVKGNYNPARQTKHGIYTMQF